MVMTEIAVIRSHFAIKEISRQINIKPLSNGLLITYNSFYGHKKRSLYV
jgi:hypothetical protein